MVPRRRVVRTGEARPPLPSLHFSGAHLTLGLKFCPNQAPFSLSCLRARQASQMLFVWLEFKPCLPWTLCCQSQYRLSGCGGSHNVASHHVCAQAGYRALFALRHSVQHFYLSPKARWRPPRHCARQLSRLACRACQQTMRHWSCLVTFFFFAQPKPASVFSSSGVIFLLRTPF